MSTLKATDIYFHCPKCKQKLVTSTNALIVQCTSCNEICLPYGEYFASCIECNRELFYPPSAQVIQCSYDNCKCLMDVSVNPIKKCHINNDGKIIQKRITNNTNDNNNQNDDIMNDNLAPFKTAFDFFVSINENDQSYNYLNKKQKHKLLQMKWGNLNLKEREKYIIMSIDDRKKYFDQLQNTTKNNNNNNNDDDDDIDFDIDIDDDQDFDLQQMYDIF